MRRRPLHWVVLCFATLWFGILVPVHNRGEIGLPGDAPDRASSRAAATAGHCHAAPTPAQAEGTGRHCPDPKAGRSGACAVCFFVAGLDAPPPVSVIITRLGAAGVLDLPPPAELPAARVTLPFHSRAPPHA